ncbi:family 20 glycosylhydrolase [Flavivirga spongiicola]|uniref:beta-N-acetylhexosaminidase n=1 Tax=Flavivirga spongiicola TaxID=421621 RepID=A0ABU7XQS4_9FLAO|nr:family 20 glycosylhydrolase [Flavivirga sp. MEBiC05379]MDO5978100.1 family 20 glycosylhydrolase [Flavivirga sp. MEBiC05379]
MKKRHCFILLMILIITSCKDYKSEHLANNISIIPKPVYLKQLEGGFLLNDKTFFVSSNEEEDKIASYFNEKIKKSTGFKLNINRKKSGTNNIIFKIDKDLELNKEGYILNVSSDEIVVKSKHYQGLFYGMQTMMQLLPPEIESDVIAPNVEWVIPNVEIKDQPEFGWRGLNLDVSRYFSSVDFIKKQLDILSLFKINKFHWHLTDDQGWRVEVKKYPKLTTISSKRKNDDGSIYGEYYTQEDIKEVVAYAKERFIDVMPEIDVPGHVVAVLAAYPELSCAEKHLETRVLWGIDSNILCAGKENTFKFLEDVFEEIVPLFPFDYVHIGGDEVPKNEWESCQRCQKRIQDEDLKDESQLQSYFMTRVENMLKKHNKKIFGWDEILEGGISETANIMSWTGEEGGITSANAGHDVVMNPSKYTYINFYQGDHHVEPMAFGAYISLKDIYNYNPIPSKIAEDKRKHILGSQASVWTEYAATDSIVEYQLYPRILAMAELTWTPTKDKNYENFLERLNNQYKRLDELDLNYHIPLPEGPLSNQVVFIDSVSLSFKTTHPVKMVYTLDGSNPTNSSKEYQEPINFTESKVLKIASVLPQGKMSSIRKVNIEKKKSIEGTTINDTKPGLLVKTVKGHFKNLNDVDFTTNYTVSKIDSIQQANKAYDWGHFIKEDNLRALSIEGYIDIKESGVYYFSSNQDQVWIAGQKVIDYKAPIKKHPKKSSIALGKGKHKLKIIYLNNIVKGWASDWNTVELRYKKPNGTEFLSVESKNLSH